MLYTQEAIIKKQKRRIKIKNISSILVYIIVIPLLIYNISLIVQAVINPDKTPSFFGIKTYVVISGSMEPNLKIGDIVIAKEVEENELKETDIICFRQGQSVITHRISSIIKDTKDIEYKTKGDNNNTEDSGTITAKLIEGKVISKIPFLGKITLLMKGKIFIIVVIITAYMFLSYSNKMKNKKSQRRLKRLKYEQKNKI